MIGRKARELYGNFLAGSAQPFLYVQGEARPVPFREQSVLSRHIGAIGAPINYSGFVSSAYYRQEELPHPRPAIDLAYVTASTEDGRKLHRYSGP
jgi:hypothetical protein